MDLLEMLKLANIFSPTGQMSNQQFPVGSIGGPVDPNVGSQPQSQGVDLMAQIQDLLSPKDQQFQNYAQMINSMPNRADYQPSKFRQIAAAIAGMGTGGAAAYDKGAALGFKSDIPTGLKVQQAINEEPYSKALTDWSNKLEPTGKIAQMEQTRNVGNRATGLGVLQKQQAQEKLDEQERANLEKERQGRDKIQIQQERADAYVKAKNFAIEHPDYKPFVDEDGDLVLYNPKDPTAAPIETGVKKLSEMEKIDLQVQGELKKINARATATKDIEGVRQANRKELEGVRQINRLDLKTTPAPVRPSVSSTSPAGIKTARINKAIDIINQHPELVPYFVKGGNKQPTGELTQEPDKKDPKYVGYAVAQRLMNEATSDTKLGDDTKPTTKTEPQSTTPSRELTRPTNEDPKIKAARAKVEPGYVLITDGKSFGQVKPADIDKLPKGWMVVK